jgi:isoquinoline 1-oxidoreductase beta subunit
MRRPSTHRAGRRRFLERSAALGASLVVGFAVPQAATTVLADDPVGPLAPNAWLRLGADGDVLVLISQTEMGQGISTGLAMALAEDLGADWTRVRFAFATGHPDYRNRVLLPSDQITGGSRSMQAFFEPLRRAGATARAMLIAAAAKRWKVAVDECAAAEGEVRHAPSGRTLPFGELVEDASAQPVPAEVPLKPRSAWTLIGQPAPRLDSREKCDGSAMFGIDVRLPGMVYAAVRHAPVFGAQVATHDPQDVLAQPGVVAVVPLPGAIGVVAQAYWQAVKALHALDVTFTATGREGYSSEAHAGALTRALDQGTAAAAPAAGDAAAAFAPPARSVEAEYRAPFLAHATLEPINATAAVDARGCDIWAPTQAPTAARRAAAELLGMEEARVRVHMTHAGGGFGRRGATDVIAQAVLLARAVERPVKVIWSREEDTQQDFYRPAVAARLSAALDEAGRAVALRARVASSGPLMFNRPEAIKNGLDPMAITGIVDLPYAIEHRTVESVEVAPPVRVGMWRSTSNSQNTFFLESFVDELAHAAGRDPLAYRRELVSHDPRALAVLERAGRESGWGSGDGHYRGVAYLHAPRWKTRVGTVVDLAGEGELLRIARVVCVADSGLVVNPNLAHAQLEGGVVFALSAALHGEITLEAGRVAQSNFHDYPLLRIGQTPRIDTFLIEGEDQPGSFGEVSVPGVAPALANALFAATGQRCRSLPLRGPLA